MQSKIRGAKLAWGKPILRINDAVIAPPEEFTPLLVADNDIKTGGVVLFYKDKGECNASFEMQIDMPIARSMRRLFRFRIPRKKKKAYKKALAKRFGIKTAKLRIKQLKCVKSW